ncbi:MAG: abortive infection family protein [Treponema sp.]|nr:abortive infection family protein [Treponema sp.]
MMKDNRIQKIDLILDDLLSGIEYYTVMDTDSFFSTGSLSSKRELVFVDNIYKQIYNEYPDKYKRIFSIFHQNINSLFNFMNQKMDNNRHFNANESRELIEIISKINDLNFNLKKEGIEIIIENYYKKIIDVCNNFLSSSGGSRIPEELNKINIIKYEPIFFINNSSAMTTKQQAASIKLEFDNKYMQQQIEQMVESIEKHPSDAIGKAKELIESCCKAILTKNENIGDLDSLDINALIKKVKEKLKLESEHPSIKQIIGGLSGVALGIAQLRNAKGTGHGKNAVKFKEPSIIEARLSVDSAIALVHFFWNLNKEKTKI